MPQIEVFILVAIGIAIVAYLRWYYKPAKGPAHLEIYSAGYRSYQDPDGQHYLIHVHASDATPALRKAIAVGAVLSEQNGFPSNRIETGRPLTDMQQWLADSWDVHNEAQAKHQIQHLFDEGHRVVLDRVAQVGGSLPTSELADVLVAEFEGSFPKADLLEFADNFAATGPTLVGLGRLGAAEDLPAFGSLAYDLGRAVTVSRVAAAAGHLSIGDAEAYCAQALAMAEATFPTWGSFATSYLAGRALWGGVNDPSFQLMADVVEILLDQQQSPWLELPLRTS